jgi:hypothetical protein
MVRDTDLYNEWLEKHRQWAFDYFTTMKNKMIEKAKWWKDVKGDLEKWNDLLTESEKMIFQFDKKAVSVNYGSCSKFNKPVSFIPNTCQPDTQYCFENRKNI